MLEVWATLKVWLSYIIPAIVIAIIVLVFVCISFIQSFKWNRKIRWLKTNNFERYLIGVPSVGGGAFYGWRNKETGKQIDERDLKHLKFKSILARMEEPK